MNERDEYCMECSAELKGQSIVIDGISYCTDCGGPSESDMPKKKSKVNFRGFFCARMYTLHEPDMIGVDFDGTLAKTFTPYDPHKVGPPVMKMVRRVRKALAEGKKVVILTARVHSSHTPMQLKYTRKLIGEWCKKYLGQKLPITSEKHPRMAEIWDDRVRQVERDTGRFVA